MHGITLTLTLSRWEREQNARDIRRPNSSVVFAGQFDYGNGEFSQKFQGRNLPVERRAFHPQAVVDLE